MKVPFIDLKIQTAEVKEDIKKAIDEVLRQGDFILGKEVRSFEREFAQYCGVRFAVGVNSGTDALFLSLLACGISKGDEVIVPVFTFVSTALAVSYIGAVPVFVDIDEKTYNIDVDKIRKAITKKTKAIIPVHLYGQPANMDAILKIAKECGLKVIEDAAQAHGSLYKGKKTGSIADVGCFSFYPTKNLGAFGDGGMVITDDEKIYKSLLMLRDYGRQTRYAHIILGYNSRLDSLQAAILSIKLKKLDNWNNMRRENASIYTNLLKGIKEIIPPYEEKDGLHVYHLYVVRLKDRDKVIQVLGDNKIEALIHYPIPLHLQPLYKSLGYKNGNFPIAEKVADEIISLPMYPHITKEQIKYTVDTLRKAINN